MPFLNGLRHFPPVIKMIPLARLDAQAEGFDENILGCMVAAAAESLDEMEKAWASDRDTDLKDKFQRLRYQLNALREYCENHDDEMITDRKLA